MKSRPLILGTRGSGLALAQTIWVKEQLEKRYPRLRFEMKIIKTQGDRLQKERGYEVDPVFGVIPKQASKKTSTLPALPKGLFTKELESALLLKKIDIAV